MRPHSLTSPAQPFPAVAGEAVVWVLGRTGERFEDTDDPDTHQDLEGPSREGR